MNINLPEKATRIAGRSGLLLKKHSPEILLAAGIVGGITAAVMAAKAHKHAEKTLKDERLDLNMFNDAAKYINPKDEAEVADYRKAMVQVYTKYGLGLAKVYGPSVALGIASITALVGSHGIMQRRSASLMAAYALLQEGFDGYRKRVAEVVGEEKERELKLGITEEEVEREVLNEKTGRKKKVKENVKVAPGMPSIYSRFFDETSVDFKRDPLMNLTYLKARQAYANDEFRIRGHMFLNEVYDLLGLPRSSAGTMVGWIYDEKSPQGDNFIDFGLYDAQYNSQFINGYEEVALLDFNVDGVIYDLI